MGSYHNRMLWQALSLRLATRVRPRDAQFRVLARGTQRAGPRPMRVLLPLCLLACEPATSSRNVAVTTSIVWAGDWAGSSPDWGYVHKPCTIGPGLTGIIEP